VKLLAFFLSSVAVLSALTDQGVVTSKWDQRRKLYPELIRTFDLAEAGPAPLRALALLRIASAAKLKDDNWKSDLLEESFEGAAQSALPWPVSPVAGPEGPTAAFLRRVRKSAELNVGLDRLSLQTGAVRSMLLVDKQKAHKLFDSIPPLTLSPLTCSDSFVPNVEAYYQTAALLAKMRFSSQEKGQRERADFLRTVVLSISSAVEIAPATQMLLDQNLPSDEFSDVVGAFAQKLEKLTGDSRSFFDHLDSTSELVLKLSDSLGGKEGLALLKAWRTYLLRNLGGVRCAETVDTKWAYSRWATESVAAFNLKAAHSESLPPIEQEDVRPDKVDLALPEDPITASPQEQDFDKQWFALMFGGQGKNLSDEQKSTAEWKAGFDEFVSAIENLEPSGEFGSDLIWQKCELMGMAVLVAPGGPERDRVADRYVTLLKIANMPPGMLPAWYNTVSSLIDLAQSIYHDRERILKALENSGDPFLTLVAKIHRLGPANSAAGERFVGTFRITSF